MLPRKTNYNEILTTDHPQWSKNDVLKTVELFFEKRLKTRDHMFFRHVLVLINSTQKELGRYIA